jgi:hypothetical protein
VSVCQCHQLSIKKCQVVKTVSFQKENKPTTMLLVQNTHLKLAKNKWKLPGVTKQIFINNALCESLVIGYQVFLLEIRSNKKTA